MSSCCQKISVGREGIFFFFEKYFFLKSRLFLWCYLISYKMNQQWFYHIIYTLCVIKSKNTNGRSIVNGNTNIFALIFSVTSPDKMRKKTSLPGENFFFIWKFSPGRSSGNGIFFYFCLDSLLKRTCPKTPICLSPRIYISWKFGISPE